MKLKGKPLLFRTIIGEEKHKKKLYQVTIKEDLTENDFEIWELDDMGPVRSVVLKRYRRVTGTIFLRKCNGEK